ncbi:hypothetical protein QBX67_13165 [Bacillus sp. LS15-K4]|nr:hypothetical protein [Bacillus sp. LS15-K4]MDJ1476237.1 hypothetical protein [Bacillus sp. LS15-K4]
MPFQYQFNPFRTTEQVVMTDGCHQIGAKDLGFNNMEFGTQVFAVESGTVVFIRRDAQCFSRPTEDPNDNPNIWELYNINTNEQIFTFNRDSQESINNARALIPPECGANQIVVRGSDNFFTSYVHVLPSNNLAVGSIVRIGDLLGEIDNSALVSGPHIHFERIRPNPNFDPINPFNSPYWINGGTCNWTMFYVTGIVPTPSNGWVEDTDNETWYYYINGVRQKNTYKKSYDKWYWLGDDGAITGSYYYYDNDKQYYRLWWVPTRKWYKWINSNWVLE